MDIKLLFESKILGSYLRVYSNRVEFNSPYGKYSILLDKIASVNLPFLGGRSICIETTGGEKHTIVTKDKKSAISAIAQAQTNFQNKNSQKNNNDMPCIADEIEKLASLLDRKLISRQEFEDQKRKLLL